MSLVVTRQKGQSVIVNGPCKVTIHKVRGGRIELQFHAEPSVKILREEVVNQIVNKADGLRIDPAATGQARSE